MVSEKRGNNPQRMVKVKNKWTSKKLAIMAVLYLIGVVYILLQKATFIDWTSYVIWLYVIYSVGNVGTKVAIHISKGSYVDLGISRKLIGFILLLVTGIAFTFIPDKSGVGTIATFKELSGFIQSVFAIYVGGNVGDKGAVLAGKFLKAPQEETVISNDK